MYFYNSFRSYARSMQQTHRFVLLHGRDDAEHGASSRGGDDIGRCSHLPVWDEKDKVHVDSWLESCDSDTSHGKSTADARNHYHARFCPNNRRKALAKKLRNRIGSHLPSLPQRLLRRSSITVNATCFVHHPTARETGMMSNCAVPPVAGSSKTIVGEVVRSNSSAHRDARNKNPAPSSKSVDDWSPAAVTVMDESEVRLSRPAKKPRRVTRYHATSVTESRPSRTTTTTTTTLYHAAPKEKEEGWRFTRGRPVVNTRPMNEKAQFGRHLEWLKFLA
ncbi:unnamed protein product [Blumeria hordei]|uniref:Uncharacterized protein n=1 Tax=Blumeria hordei TaxID=2867405 RepID=A0A383UIV3_BLUHO|nr:unnamed protein product [Blumeria hordei]